MEASKRFVPSPLPADSGCRRGRTGDVERRRQQAAWLIHGLGHDVGSSIRTNPVACRLMTSLFTEESVVRLRTILTSLTILVLGGSAILSSAVVRAQPHRSIHLAAALAARAAPIAGRG